MLIRLNLLPCQLRINSILLHGLDHLLIHIYVRVPHIDPPNLFRLFWFIFLVPVMASNLINCESPVRIRVEDLVKQIFGQGGHEVRHLELPCEDLLVKLCCVGVFEGEVATDHCVEDDASAPDVDAGWFVLFAGDHFRGGVAWWATRCF